MCNKVLFVIIQSISSQSTTVCWNIPTNCTHQAAHRIFCGERRMLETPAKPIGSSVVYKAYRTKRDHLGMVWWDANMFTNIYIIQNLAIYIYCSSGRILKASETWLEIVMATRGLIKYSKCCCNIPTHCKIPIRSFIKSPVLKKLLCVLSLTTWIISLQSTGFSISLSQADN